MYMNLEKGFDHTWYTIIIEKKSNYWFPIYRVLSLNYMIRYEYI